MGKDRKWPPFCVLCMREATTQDVELINGDHAPYCETCKLKVKRLRNWKDTIFAIALIIGGIFAILGLVYVVVEETWLALFRTNTYLRAFGGGMIVGLAIFAVLHILIFPVRLTLSGKLANPGVKLMKTKEAGIIVLRFSNPTYAEKFRDFNREIVVGKNKMK